MLDRNLRGILARGAPRDLAERSDDARVRAFFGRKTLQEHP